MQIPKKIGEGSYGCVFKPSMKCKTGMPSTFKSDDYISKFMKKNNAKEEFDEFVKFNKIDPSNDFHLGLPTMCDPDLNDPMVKQEISTCTNMDLQNVTQNPSNYKLLIIKYGGPDLKNFCDKFAVSYFITNQTAKEKKRKKEKFLLEILHLLKGLKFFRDNGLVHYDLKPQNILFNLKDGSMRFIDFGLMREKKTINDESKLSINNLGVFHWSYPLDTGFMNKNMFDKIKTLTPNEANLIAIQTYAQIIKGSTNNVLIPIKNPKNLLNMYTQYIFSFAPYDRSKIFSLILDFFKGFTELAKNNSYEYVLDKIIDSIDIYGLGFTLKYTVTCLFHNNILNFDEVSKLYVFLDSMIQFNSFKRKTNFLSCI